MAATARPGTACFQPTPLRRHSERQREKNTHRILRRRLLRHGQTTARCLATQHRPINIPSARERSETRLSVETDQLPSHQSVSMSSETRILSLFHPPLTSLVVYACSVLCEKYRPMPGERQRRLTCYNDFVISAAV